MISLLDMNPEFMTIVVLLKDGDTCQSCNIKPGRIRRQNTQYYIDSSNWILACDECFEKIQEHWSDMWTEYYRGCM
jgi:hypothetical protein